MKRIAGIYHFDGTPVRESTLRRMLGAMQQQAGDPPEIHLDGPVGLGILQIGSRAQPISQTMQPGSPLILALDGRLDNRAELAAQLKVTRDSTNEALLLAAYEKWGSDCAAHLLGDFAFALWDSRSKTLLCARDHLGVKPLYYYNDGRLLVFASTPRAILASGCVPCQINEARIADFLVDYLEGIDKEVTFFEGIFRLPPAHVLNASPQGMALSCYWQPEPALLPQNESDEFFVASFQALFSEAVRCRMDSACAQASMLSGGIDSCSIVATARKILAEGQGQALQTFSGIMDNFENDRESAHIQAVLAQGGLNAHLLPESQLYDNLETLIQYIFNEDDPNDCLMNLPRMVYMSANNKALQAVMDGIDGDVLLGRSNYITPLWRSGKIAAAIGETLAAGGVAAELESRRALFFNSLRTALAPDWIRDIRREKRIYSAVDDAVRTTLIRREFADDSDLRGRHRTFETHNKTPSHASQIDFHFGSITHANLTAGIERYERTASAFGIEARHPLLDVRLVEFCLGLPWQLKAHRGWTKRILRLAMKPLLPQQVVWRVDKDQLMWHFNQVILKEKTDQYYQLTLDEHEALEPYVNTQRLATCWRNYRTNGDYNSSLQIWSGIALALWLRRERELAGERRPEAD